MLLLCSDGLTNSKLQNCVKEFGGKTAALVVSADHVYKEKNYHVPRVTEELQQCGLTVDLFDLDIQCVNELLCYDVIEFIGGNPYYLLKLLRECHAEKILTEFAQNRCLIGWSAGAIVMGPTIGIIDVFSPEMNQWGLTDLTGMNLTDVQILPHYDKFLNRYDKLEERCLKYEKENLCQVIRLNDGEGIVIKDNKRMLIK